MNDTTIHNPLIQSKPSDTISHCADVIDYIAYFNDNGAGEPSEDIKHGRLLIIL